MMKPVFTIVLAALMLQLSAQPKPEIVSYIDKYKDVAIEEMVRTNIPASITLAQGIFESGCGMSDLSVKANNHFGIKCKDEWTGKRFYQNDDAPNECFRVYENARESYADHSDFLVNRSRYADLFKLPAGDYKSWAYGLKAAGYATNPHYAGKLITYIEEYQLHHYDEVGYAIIKARENEPPAIRAPKAEQAAAPVETPKERPIATPTQQTAVNKSEREEFLVNGLRTIKATSAETPFSIAIEYNIDYYHILSFNDLNDGDKFKEGQNIFLQPKRNRAEETTHSVKAGESMLDIAQLYGVKVKDLYYKNQMKLNDQPVAGEKVYLKDKRSSAPKTMSYSAYLKEVNKIEEAKKAEQRAKDSRVINNNDAYQVQQKDTLYSIAKKFNTTVDKIRELNSLDSSYIKPGQTLLVSE